MSDCFGIDKLSKSMIETIGKDDLISLLKTMEQSIILDIQDSILQKQNPIGKLYFSTSNTNPAEILGFGTWVLWGSGRVPVCVNESDTNFNTVEKTGGESSITLSTSQIPSHTHTFSGSQVKSGNQSVNHTHSIPALSGSATGGAVKNGITGGSHSHDIVYGSYIHDIVYGSHIHDIVYTTDAAPGFGKPRLAGLDKTKTTNDFIVTDFTVSSSTHTHNLPSHTHSVTTKASTSGKQSASHTHTVTAAGTNSNTGGGKSHSNLQPYITCYIFKRTA